MTKRVAILAEIALRYHELVDPGLREGLRGDGNGCPRMPTTYTPTVKEFERLMRLMRSQARQQASHGESVGTLRWHVNAWYVNAQKVVRHRPVHVPSHGKLKALRDQDGHIVTRPVVSYRRHPDARQQKADWGIEWIAQHWGLETEPMLPEEIRAT